MMEKRMKKAPIKAKNESNSSLFANFLTQSGVFCNFLTRATSYAKVSLTPKFKEIKGQCIRGIIFRVEIIISAHLL